MDGKLLMRFLSQGCLNTESVFKRLCIWLHGVFVEAAGSPLHHVGVFLAVHKFSSCGAQASVVAVLRLSCSTACGILIPQPSIKLMSPALQGKFLTTGLPGKPLKFVFDRTAP